MTEEQQIVARALDKINQRILSSKSWPVIVQITELPGLSPSERAALMQALVRLGFWVELRNQGQMGVELTSWSLHLKPTPFPYQ